MITASPGEVTDKEELHGRYFLCRSCEQWEKCNYHEMKIGRSGKAQSQEI